MTRNNGNGNGTPNHGIGNGKGQGYDNGEGHEKQEDKELNKPEAYEYIRYLNDISVPYPQVLMTADSKGTYRGVYTYGLERISVRDEVSVEGKPNNPLYYLYDGRGSVSQLTNTNGNVRDQYRYEPFGAPMPGGGLEPDTRLLNNPYGYNGEDYDIESDLQYLRARYYDPEIGRFISEDSYLGEIMQPLTLNRYAYTANNPLMYQDPSGHSVVKLGSRGQSVKELQQLLISSGYNGLKVDGIFGKDTLSAVIAYQTSKGLAVDGIVGSQTWEALRNTYTSNPTLRKGSRGGAVTELQQGLMRLDYLGPYGADGVFGNQTEKAVKEFQRKNGLDPDGIVGKQTWAALAQKKVISNNRNNCGGIPKVEIPDITKKLNNLMAEYEAKYKYVTMLSIVPRLQIFYYLVKNNAELDLKNQPGWKNEQFIYNGEIIDNDVPGNIMYGYMGKVFGFPDTLLYAAAGHAQKKAGTSKDEWNNLTNFGDDPRDTERIRQGIEIYNKNHKLW